MLEFFCHAMGQLDRTQRAGPVRWPHFDLFFVHQGSVRMDFPELRQTTLLTRGTGVLIWPETYFSGAASGRMARASIQHFAVSGNAEPPFRSLAECHNGFSVQTTAPSAELDRDVARALALAARSPSGALTLMRRSLLALILAGGGYAGATVPPDGAYPLDLSLFESWLQTHLSENPGVPDLARLTGLSPSRFRAVFRQRTGQSAGEFIRACRDREARRLLIQTRHPLKAVSALLGYADPVAFTRAFKSRSGLTPGEFRKQNAFVW